MTNVQKSLYKSISYRLLSIVTTFTVSYFITGSLTIASAIVSIDAIIKMVIYFVHERVWHRIYKKFKNSKDSDKWQYKAHKQ